MQMLEPRLDFGSIATNPTESVRPDLWPDHAWVPALGEQGNRLIDVAGNAQSGLGVLYSYWIPDGLANNADSADVVGAIATVDCSNDFSFVVRFKQFTQSRYNNYVISAGTGPLINILDTISPHNVVVSNTATTIQTYDYIEYAFAVSCDVSASTCSVAINGRYVLTGTNSIPASVLSLYLMGGAGSKYYNLRGVVGELCWYSRTLAASQLVDLSADPLLPFRRAPQVSYFIAAGLAIPIILNHARRRRT